MTEKDTLKIVLAPIGKLSEARSRYYDLIDSYQVNNYQKTIQKLEEDLHEQRISLEEYRQRTQEAEKTLQDAYYLLEQYADRYARINKDDLDSISRIAYESLDKGDVEFALKVYDDQHLLDKFKEKKALHNQSLESISTLVSMLKQEIQVRMLASDQENFEKIKKIWEQIILYDGNNTSNISEYQAFLKEYQIASERDSLDVNYNKEMPAEDNNQVSSSE